MSSIEPFYFGQHDELLGIYHPAAAVPRNHAVIIAGPLLNEYMRAHFALRQISIKLARDGFDVLRFDYAGMGNSTMSPESVSPGEWADNISVATRELVDISGSSSASIVAVRFAANLAATLTEETDINRFVMWDPILVGGHWVELLYEAQRNVTRKFSASLLVTDREFMGHAMSSTFVDEIRTRELSNIHSQEQYAVITDKYRHIDTLRKTTDDIHSVSFSCSWEDLTSQVLYPHEVINSICAALK